MQNQGLAWLEIDLDAVGHNVSMIKGGGRQKLRNYGHCQGKCLWA